MKKLDDRIWSAYLDGELSVSEIEEVEGSLTGKQLEHFRKEKVLEEKINQRLEDGITCPTDLWQSICTKIGRGKSKSPKKIIYFSTFLSAAACLTIFFFLNKNETAIFKVPLTLSELKNSSKTKTELLDVNNFLKVNNVDLKLNEFVEGGHPKKLIGASLEKVGNEEVVTLLFNCCGFPVKIYVLPKGSAAEKFVVAEDTAWKKGIEGQVKKGEYRLALVSAHGAMDILEAIVPT